MVEHALIGWAVPELRFGRAQSGLDYLVTDRQPDLPANFVSIGGQFGLRVSLDEPPVAACIGDQ